MIAPIPASAHRPWPAPARPWAMAMTWEDVLFLHWPVPPEALAGFIPPPLRLDTFDGQAWLGVVPFRMSGIHLRGLPPIPGTAAFPEINVRTYAVAPDGRTGVWFFSLDATSRLAVRAARVWFGLPYFDARIRIEPVAASRAGAAADARIVIPANEAGSAVGAGEAVNEGGESDVGDAGADSLGDRAAYRFTSTRTHRGAPPAAFAGTYRSTGPVAPAARGTLDHWLTERYALFAVDRRGRVGCGEIHHKPWPLQPATANVAANTMAEPIGLVLPAPAPLAHFARRLDVVAWTVRPLDRTARSDP